MPKPKAKPKAKSTPTKRGSKNVGGRPRLDIDYTKVVGMSAQQNTEHDIAIKLGMTPEGFRLRKGRDPELLGALERGRSLGRMSLRQMQYESAKGGNWNAQKWLGQQYLGQSDKQEIDQTLHNVIDPADMTDEQLVAFLATKGGGVDAAAPVDAVDTKPKAKAKKKAKRKTKPKAKARKGRRK